MSKKLFVICRWEIKVAEEKKERDFNVKVNNVSVEVRIISFNKRVQLSKFYWWNIKWNIIDETEDLDLFALAMHLHYYPLFFLSLSLSPCVSVFTYHTSEIIIIIIIYFFLLSVVFLLLFVFSFLVVYFFLLVFSQLH